MNQPMKKRRRFHAALLAGFCLAALPGLAQAQAWPAKPVRFVVPFPPGGSSDIVARQLAQHLGKTFGQSFTVDNRAGAGGNIGTDTVAKSAPDGYTMGLSTSGPLANNKSLYKDMPFDSEKDLAPIALVGEIPLVIASTPAVKAANLKEFVALMKAQSARFAIGHPGNGTIGHLALEYFKGAAGVSPQSIPYKGDTPALADLLGGQIQGLAAPITAFIAGIQSGKLTGLAVTSKRRFPALPNLQTAIEQGIDLEATVWFAVVGPAGMSAPVVTRVNQEVNKYTSSAEGKARLAEFGMVETNGPPELLGTLMRSEAAKWKKLVEAAKISIE